MDTATKYSNQQLILVISDLISERSNLAEIHHDQIAFPNQYNHKLKTQFSKKQAQLNCIPNQYNITITFFFFFSLNFFKQQFLSANK